MPIKIEYTKDLKGVSVIHDGIVTGEELIDAIADIYQDERFQKLKYWIADRTNSAKYEVSSGQVERIAELSESASTQNPDMLLALVAPKDLEFGMSRMFQFLSEGKAFKTEVFKDRLSAEKWIEDELAEPDDEIKSSP